MSRPRQRLLHQVGALSVAVILLIPLALSGHRHGADQRSSSDSCAVCAVTAHSPAVDSTAVPVLVPTLQRLVTVDCVLAAPAATYQPFKAGRAPPSSPSLILA